MLKPHVVQTLDEVQMSNQYFHIISTAMEQKVTSLSVLFETGDTALMEKMLESYAVRNYCLFENKYCMYMLLLQDAIMKMNTPVHKCHVRVLCVLMNYNFVMV